MAEEGLSRGGGTAVEEPEETEVYRPKGRPQQRRGRTEVLPLPQAPEKARGAPAAAREGGVAGRGGGSGPGPGDRVRQYELIRQLGKGGMGEVFLARDTKLGRRVAIKFLTAHDPELAQRFVQEARATARCGHENIVTIYEADAFEGRPYMVLEYLQGHTLAELLADGKAMPASRVAELASPVVFQTRTRLLAPSATKS